MIIASLCLSGCASTSTHLPKQNVASVETPPQIQVRPASRTSAHLFAIEDPLTLAVEARFRGDDEKAFEHFYAAWRATPQNQDVASGLIDMALKTGNKDVAYAASSRIRLAVEDVKPSLLSAQVLAEIAVGNSADPELRLNQALEFSPNDARLWNALGRFHDSNGQFSRAREYYVKAVANGGNRAVAINDLGMSHLLAGEKALALDKFKQAVELAPGSALYDNNRRLTLALKSDYLGATANLASGEAANILNDAGFIAKSRGDGAQAITLFEAAIKQSRVYHAKAHNNLKRAKELSEN